MKRIAEQFRLDGAVQSVATLGEGFINDTYIVTTERTRYVLQRKNRNVFTDIPAMMRNIEGVTSFLREKVRRAGGDPRREVMTVIPTHDGALYYEDAAGDYWAATLFIEDSVTCQSASTPELARCGGEGIGRFQRMLADYGEPLADILPGFHDIRFRFRQWDDALARDAAGRRASVAREIEWIECRRDEMLRFWQRVETGEIPRRVTHNDTKINNILFDRQGRVLCVIDLDTVLRSPCFNDFGDAIRTYANHGREDDENLDDVWLDMTMFRGFAEGYLSEARAFLTPGRNRRTRLLGTLHHLRTGAALPDGLSRRRHLLQDQVARPQPRPYAGAVRTAPQRRGALRRDAGDRRRTGRAALTAGTDKNRDDPDEFTPAQRSAPG